MRGNSNADNGKNIRHNFVSQSLPHHNSMQEFEQREVKNGNKEKKQKGLKRYQMQNVFRKSETRMERDLTRVLWCWLRLSSVNTRSEMYVRFYLHVQVCILFGVCKIV